MEEKYELPNKQTVTLRHVFGILNVKTNIIDRGGGKYCLPEGETTANAHFDIVYNGGVHVPYEVKEWRNTSSHRLKELLNDIERVRYEMIDQWFQFRRSKAS